MIIGTAGHIDHGKTALVKALTGIDADRLKEEKARGITIDLGYAYTPLPNGDILGFVDVPGHERFIHNMLAGATGIEFALLVVAADDGPMPQTVEHLRILDLLGMARGAVALAKIDLVSPERVAEAALEIADLLDGTSLADAPVFPVAAVTGAGVMELRAHLEAIAATVGAKAIRGGFRLAVDRVFSVAGAGTVVTGSVFSGQVGIGDRLILSPSGRPVRVRGIHAQNRPARAGYAGQRCALNLADVETSEIRRGDWVLAPALHRPAWRLDARLKLLAGEDRPLRHWTPVHVHLGADHVTGRVALLGDEPLQPGESAYAQLVLDRLIGAVNGDRCILRDASAQRTLAGGRVLDAPAPSRGRRTPARLAVLAALEREEPAERLRALLEVSPLGVDLISFAANANLASPEIDALGVALSLRCVEGTHPLGFLPEHWERLKQAVVDSLRKEHEEVPDSPGLNAEQLRLRTAPRLDRTAFAGILAECLEHGICARDGSWWHLPGHAITLSEADQALWNRISPRLAEQPFQPPRVRDLARAEALEEAAARKLLQRVARTGQVYKVAHDHYFERAAVAELAAIVRSLADAHPDGAVLASEFRDRIGTGRKLAIHILEFFDRVGLTRRIRDQHRPRDGELAF